VALLKLRSVAALFIDDLACPTSAD